MKHDQLSFEEIKEDGCWSTTLPFILWTFYIFLRSWWGFLCQSIHNGIYRFTWIRVIPPPSTQGIRSFTTGDVCMSHLTVAFVGYKNQDENNNKGISLLCQCLRMNVFSWTSIRILSACFHSLKYYIDCFLLNKHHNFICMLPFTEVLHKHKN